MSILVELLLRNPPLFAELHDAAPETRGTLENFHYFTDGDSNHYALFIWVRGDDLDRFERAAERYRYTREIRTLATVDDRRLYRVTTNPLPDELMIFPRFRRWDVSVLDNEGSTDGFWLRLRVPDRDVLKGLVEELRQLGTNPHVERIYLERRPERDGRALTERQRECLALAFEEGYFESPSQVTLAELADDLDITAQTLSKHIRAGVRKLVETEVEGDSERRDGESGPAPS